MDKPMFTDEAVYFNIAAARANWNTEVTVKDLLYRRGKYCDKHAFEWVQINGGRIQTLDESYMLNTSRLSEERVNEIFSLVKACASIDPYKSLHITSASVLDFFEKKGEIYSRLKKDGYLELVSAYVTSGSDKDYTALAEEHKKREEAHRKQAARGSGSHAVAAADKEIDVVGKLLKELSTFEGVREYSRKLFDTIRTRVIGQDDALRSLIIKLVSYMINPHSQSAPILVSGPTGVGKTYAIRLISNAMGMPFLEISTPELSPASYRGTTIQDVLFAGVAQQIETHGGYPNRMIVYLDEFGKILFRGDGRGDSFSTQIQNEFLKLLEPGATIKNSGMFGIISELPFRAMIVLSDALSFIKPESGVITRRDLVAAGFTPELAGRIQLIPTFNRLTAADFERILLEGHDTVLASKIQFCSSLGVELSFDRGAIREIAELAEKDGAGGRSLNHLVNFVVDRQLNERIFSDKTKVDMMLRINKGIIRRTFPNNGKSVRGYKMGFAAT